MIQAILLVTNEIIVAQSLPEVDSDTGETQFTLMYPYLLTFSEDKFELTPWLEKVTNSSEKFIVYPDKIITIIEPKSEILNFYKKIVLFDKNVVVRDEIPEFTPVKVIKPEVQSSYEVSSAKNDDVDEIYGEEESL